MWQRFVNYLESDFPRLMGEIREARERDGVRVVVAGPNAFVYFLHTDEPLPIEAIDQRASTLVDDISRAKGIGFLLARSADGPVCIWRGKRYRLSADEPGPFAGRDDLPLVLEGIRDLMAMRSAGDLVIYGNQSPDGNVSYIPELGAHAGPAAEELQTFIVLPPRTRLPVPITHPTQLYEYFWLPGHGGPDMAPIPPNARRAPAKPWNSARSVSGPRVRPLVVGSYNIHRGRGLDRRWTSIASPPSSPRSAPT